MIEILTPDDILKIKDCYIAKYIKNLFTNITSCSADCSIKVVRNFLY